MKKIVLYLLICTTLIINSNARIFHSPHFERLDLKNNVDHAQLMSLHDDSDPLTWIDEELLHQYIKHRFRLFSYLEREEKNELETANEQVDRFIYNPDLDEASRKYVARCLSHVLNTIFTRKYYVSFSEFLKPRVQKHSAFKVQFWTLLTVIITFTAMLWMNMKWIENLELKKKEIQLKLQNPVSADRKRKLTLSDDDDEDEEEEKEAPMKQEKFEGSEEDCGEIILLDEEEEECEEIIVEEDPDAIPDDNVNTNGVKHKNPLHLNCGNPPGKKHEKDANEITANGARGIDCATIHGIEHVHGYYNCKTNEYIKKDLERCPFGYYMKQFSDKSDEPNDFPNVEIEPHTPNSPVADSDHSFIADLTKELLKSKAVKMSEEATDSIEAMRNSDVESLDSE